MQMSLKKIVFSIEFFQHSIIHIFSQSNKNKIKMYHYLSNTQTSQFHVQCYTSDVLFFKV